jgi:NAD(P)-dependent dehydrogenase (short-subunit alcohol dehydrogenase family)/acyl carrier protein
MGRSAPDAAAARVIDELRARGVHVEVIAGDVTDPADCARAVAAAGAGAPLRAVFHLAGVLDDQAFDRLTPPAFERVFAAKAAGADALVAALAGRPLDALVLFSSASAVLGSPGQANYAAANGYLDGLAELLRARGVPAASIDWGPWTPAAKAGMAATARIAAAAAAQGVRPLADDDAWPLLTLGAAPGRGRLVAIAADLERFAEHNAGAPRQRLISGLVAAPSPSARPARAAVPRGWLIEQLQGSADPLAALRDALCRQICEVLGEAELDEAADFFDLGLDSIMLIDLRSRLTHALGVDLPVTAAIDHPNVTALARHLTTSGLLGAALEPGAAR